MAADTHQNLRFGPGAAQAPSLYTSIQAHVQEMKANRVEPDLMHGSDAVGQMMAKYDKDKSGSFSTEE